MKKISEMSDHEMLVELMNDKRRQDKVRYVKYIWYAIILVLLIIICLKVVPPVVSTLRRYNNFMDQFDSFKAEIENALSKINDFSLSDLFGGK